MFIDGLINKKEVGLKFVLSINDTDCKIIIDGVTVLDVGNFDSLINFDCRYESSLQIQTDRPTILVASYIPD